MTAQLAHTDGWARPKGAPVLTDADVIDGMHRLCELWVDAEPKSLLILLRGHLNARDTGALRTLLWLRTLDEPGRGTQ